MKSPSLKTIKYIVKQIDFPGVIRSPKWFFTMHLPHMIKCMIEAFYKPHSKNLYFNSRFYDGLSRNGFKKGNLISFLHKIGVVKKPYSYEKNVNRIGYFIGYQDDE